MTWLPIAFLCVWTEAGVKCETYPVTPEVSTREECQKILAVHMVWANANIRSVYPDALRARLGVGCHPRIKEDVPLG